MSFFWSEGHREVMAGLLYGAAHRLGLITLTGAPGTGKTTVIQEAAARLERLQASIRVVRLPDSSLPAPELLESVLDALGAEVAANRRISQTQLEARLAAESAQGRTCLLALDDAQLLSDESLELVRLWTDWERGGRKLLPILLAGAGTLEERLQTRGSEPLRQRVSLTLGLDPLRADEVAAYIHHRWTSQRGAEPSPFTEGAIDQIAADSCGVPRAINALTDQSLRLALARQTREIDQDIAALSADALLLPRARTRAAAAAGERRLQWVSYTKSS